MNTDDFNFDGKQVLPTCEIVTMTIDDYSNLTEGEQQSLKFKSTIVTGLPDISAFRKRMVEYVRMMNIQGYAVKAVSLSRRFHRIAKKFETTVPDAINELISRGHFVQIDQGGKTALATPLGLAEFKEVVEMTKQDLKTKLYEWVNNAQ